MAVTLLPEPLSPTRPRVSPGSMEKETSSTTRMEPAAVANSRLRLRTSTSGTGEDYEENARGNILFASSRTGALTDCVSFPRLYALLVHCFSIRGDFRVWR